MTLTALSAVSLAIRHDADVYHFHDPELAPWMMLVRFTGKPVIFDVHENVMGSLRDRPWVPKLLRQPLERLTVTLLRLVMRSFSVVFSERSYPAAYPWVKSYDVISNFPDLRYFPVPGSVAKHPRTSVVYVGGLRTERGLLDLLDAMAILQVAGDTVDLYLVGRLDEPSLGSVESLIRRRSLSNVTFLGYLPPDEAMQVVAKCHIGIAVLRSVPNYVDSYPTKIFEYMACGLPIIVSNFPLYREVVESSGCGVSIEPQNPLALAATIRELASHPDREAMGERGRRAVESRYNWSGEALRLVALYHRILEGRRPARDVVAGS